MRDCPLPFAEQQAEQHAEQPPDRGKEQAAEEQREERPGEQVAPMAAVQEGASLPRGELPRASRSGFCSSKITSLRYVHGQYHHRNNPSYRNSCGSPRKSFFMISRDRGRSLKTASPKRRPPAR